MANERCWTQLRLASSSLNVSLLSRGRNGAMLYTTGLTLMGMMAPESLERYYLGVSLVSGLQRQMNPNRLAPRMKKLSCTDFLFLTRSLCHLCCPAGSPKSVWCHLRPFLLRSYLVRSSSYRWRTGLSDWLRKLSQEHALCAHGDCV